MMRKMGMNRRCWNFLLALLLLVVTAGCNSGGGEAQLIGNWKVNADAMKMPSTGAGGNQAQQMGAELAKGLFGNMTLDLKADKTFLMNMMLPFEGTWSFDAGAKTVSLTMTKMGTTDLSKMPNAGKTAQEPMTLQLSGDGKQLSMQDKAGKANPMGTLTFEKQ